MKILALVPARGGSKRLPGKNIKLLGKKPLINWTIESAKGIPEICDVLVSTDSSEVAAIAESAGASVPWLRPKSLATDAAKSVDVALHALDWFEKTHGHLDGLLLLQPTSPFRKHETIIKGIAMYKEFNSQPILGVSRCSPDSPQALELEGEFLVPLKEIELSGNPPNSRPQTFKPNGAFYLISPRELRQINSFLMPKSIPLHIDSLRESLDIDTHLDFWFAKCLFYLDH
jgi:CMP-N,N'-diacetyllegionaminic acid synthase